MQQQVLIKCPGTVKLQLNNVQSSSDDWTSLKVSDISKIHAADTRIIEMAKENCEEWFGKKLSDEFLENVYDNGLDGDTLSVVPVKNTQGQILTRFYNSQKENVEHSTITGPYDVILELYGVTFFRKSYSPVWRILQVRERPKPIPEVPDQYLFDDE